MDEHMEQNIPQAQQVEPLNYEVRNEYVYWLTLTKIIGWLTLALGIASFTTALQSAYNLYDRFIRIGNSSVAYGWQIIAQQLVYATKAIPLMIVSTILLFRPRSTFGVARALLIIDCVLSAIAPVFYILFSPSAASSYWLGGLSFAACLPQIVSGIAVPLMLLLIIGLPPVRRIIS